MNGHRRPRWEVQQYTLCDGWINTWSEDDRPHTFTTRRDALKELTEFLADTREAALMGHLEEAYQRDEFRIVAINKEAA